MLKRSIMIIKGGNSLERDISLKSFENVIANLDKEKYNICVLDIFKLDYKYILSEIEKYKPEVVFNLLHGGQGEDGTIQGFLSMLNIKYVGSKALASGICMDKNLSKTILKAESIPTVQSVFIKKDENYIIYEDEINAMSYPVIVKPNSGGGSIGIFVAKDINETFLGIEKVRALGDDILIEKFIDGKEVTCGIVEKEDGLFVLPLLDINHQSNFFDYSSKYEKNTDISFSNLPKFLQTMIQEISKKSFKVLKCSGYANVDLIIKEEDIYVLEINTLPGFTSKSLLPQAIDIMGIEFSKFLEDIIEFELNS